MEWSLLRCLMWPLIVCEFCERQPLVPIVLVFAKASQILFQPLVRSFRLPISSRMVRSGDVLAYLECLAQSSGIFGHKLGVSIRDNLLRHPKPWVKILEQKSGDLISADCFPARYEYCGLAAIIVTIRTRFFSLYILDSLRLRAKNPHDSY